MDMGNIALHLLDQDQREHYDLEALWSLGPEFDEQTRRQTDQDSSFSEANYVQDPKI